MAEVAISIDMGPDDRTAAARLQRRWAVPLVLVVLVGLSEGACRRHPWDEPHPEWKTFRTAHFILHTDVRPSARNAVLARLEETRAALNALVFPDVSPGPIEVLLLSDRDFVALLGEEKGGIFLSDVGSFGGVLVLRDGGDFDQLARTTAHELAHRFLADGYPTLPPWLGEGIAGYLETMELRADGVVFGSPPPRAPTNTPGTPPLVSLRELAHADHTAFYRGPSAPKYEATHAFIHWLLHGSDLQGWGNGQQRWWALLSTYGRGAAVGADGRDRATPGESEGPDEVLARVFPHLDWADVQARAQAHVDRLWSSAVPVLEIVKFEGPSIPAPHVAPARPEEIKALARTVLLAREGRTPCLVGSENGSPCPTAEDPGQTPLGTPIAFCYVPGVLAGKPPAPSATPGRDAALSGYLEDVRTRLENRIPALRECAEVLAVTGRGASGATQATLHLQIGADGHVASADVSLVGGHDPELAACIAEVACGWSFSPPPAQATPVLRHSFALAEARAAKAAR